MSALKFFGIDKLFKAWNIIQEHGGIMKSLYKLYRMDDLKTGTLIGIDKFGNKYFENKNLMFGRNRWVEYSSNVGMDYDGSYIPSDWFGWMHHKTDLPPTIVKPVNYPWIAEHQHNVTGTSQAYMPYSTTKSKIEAWQPPKRQS